MGQRMVHNTHRWSKDNTCKGCEVRVSEKKAEEPCPTPYRPVARHPKERRKA